MTQDIIVIIVGVLALAWIGYKLYRFFYVNKRQIDKCAGCTGCDFYKMLNEKVPDNCKL